MDDTELAHRLARDLDGTFESLVRAHVDRCHAIALRITGNPHDAEEITQDALVRAYRRARRLRPRADPGAPDPPVARDDRAQPVPQPGAARHAATTPLDAARGGRPRAGRRRHDRPGGGSPPPPRTVIASPRCSRRSRTATGSPSSSATSTTCPTPSSRRSSAGPRARSRPRCHRGLALLRAAIAATELEELTA